ncbi:MAG: MBL fold metallo-hydrolase [Anaerolineaceae bacterium]
MQEISKGIYIETAYLGVTLGAISMPHGLILVDAPPRPEDIRSWRAALLNLGGGVDRLLINLDAHVDRTLGVRAMECTVVAHDKAAQVFRSRPTTFKAQNAETGADWELANGLGTIRWAPPEITFDQRLQLQWGDSPLIMEYHPGPSTGAIWLNLPDAHVVFVGDALCLDQPPFFANADLPTWVETLQLLKEEEYQDFTLVAGRGGLAAARDVDAQIAYLKDADGQLNALAEKGADPQETDALIPALLKRFTIRPEFKDQYTQRLRWGLCNYFSRRYRSANVENEE